MSFFIFLFIFLWLLRGKIWREIFSALQNQLHLALAPPCLISSKLIQEIIHSFRIVYSMTLNARLFWFLRSDGSSENHNLDYEIFIADLKLSLRNFDSEVKIISCLRIRQILFKAQKFFIFCVWGIISCHNSYLFIPHSTKIFAFVLCNQILMIALHLSDN